MKTVIALKGIAGSGKTTAADYLSPCTYVYTKETNPVGYMLFIIFGWKLPQLIKLQGLYQIKQITPVLHELDNQLNPDPVWGLTTSQAFGVINIVFSKWNLHWLQKIKPVFKTATLEPTKTINKLSFAFPVKQICSVFTGDIDILLGYQRGIREQVYQDLNYTPRDLLINIANTFRSEFDNQIWIKILDQKLQCFQNIVIDDLRFPTELEYLESLKAKHAVFVYTISRTLVQSNYPIILNTSLEHLYDQLENIKTSITKKKLTL